MRHKTANVGAAHVEDGAQIGKNVHIGPYCHIHSGAEIGDNCILDSHVVLYSGAKIGPGCHFHPFSSVGDTPQHLRYDGQKTRAIIGAGTTVRSHSTVHIGLETDTVVGESCFIMEMCHVGHDCNLGNHVVLASQAMLGGHVEVGDNANIAAQCGVHQFARIGKNAMIGGGSKVRHDVPPFALIKGSEARLRSLNFIGLKRSGHSRTDIHRLKLLADELFFKRKRPFQEELTAILARGETFAGPSLDFLTFIMEKRGCPLVPIHSKRLEAEGLTEE